METLVRIIMTELEIKKVRWRINLRGLENGVELLRRRVRPKPYQNFCGDKRKE